MERRGARTLAHVALENVVEGCVRETFGAAVALHQARAAEDADVRRTMRAIASDEARHAALSWEIARWSLPLLTDAERARVDAAFASAIAALEREPCMLCDEAAREVGLPSRAARRAMFEVVSRSLWEGDIAGARGACMSTTGS